MVKQESCSALRCSCRANARCLAAIQDSAKVKPLKFAIIRYTLEARFKEAAILSDIRFDSQLELPKTTTL